MWSQEQVYSFREKFFAIEPEWRIRRYQYLARVLFLCVAVWILGYWMKYIIVNFFMTSPVLMSALDVGLINFLQDIVYLWAFYFLCVKRLRDLAATHLIKIWNVIFVCFGIGLFYSMAQKWWILSIPTELWFVSIIFQFTIFLSFVIFSLYLLFFPGKKWDNEFGKDPSNTKINFFG